MKIRGYLQFLAICALLLGFFIDLRAQISAVKFTEGITVAMKTEKIPADSNTSQLNKFAAYSTYSKKDGKYIVHRVLADPKSKLYVGYDLEIIPQTSKNTFNVSIKTLSIDPNKLVNINAFTARPLPKYPNDILVSDGDTISVEILENPQTKAKIFDLTKVLNEDANQKIGNYFPERLPAKDFTIDDVQINLVNFEVFINGETYTKFSGGAQTSLVHVYFKDRGRFIFSLIPRPGYNFQKIGTIEDNKLTFAYDGITYKFITALPIIGISGKWNLWVLYDPDYKSLYETDSKIEVGASQRIEYLYNLNKKKQ